MGILKGIFKVIGGILGIPFFLASTALFTAFFILTAVGTIRNPETPKAWLNEADIYSRASDAGVAYLLGKISGQDDLLKNIASTDDIYAAAGDIFPEEWIRETFEKNIDGLYGFLRDETKTLALNIDLAGRQEAARKALGEIFKKKLATLPVCGLDNKSINPESFDLFSADCRPAAVPLTEAEALIDKGVASLAPIPEGQIEIPAKAAANLEPLKLAFGIFPKALWIVFGLFLLISGLGLFFLGGRFGGWAWGMIPAIIGAAAIFGSTLAPAAGDIIWEKYIAAKFGGFPAETASLVRDLFSAAVSGLAKTIMANGIIAAAAGFIFIFIRKIFGRLIPILLIFAGLLLIAWNGNQLYRQGLMPPGLEDKILAPIRQKE